MGDDFIADWEKWIVTNEDGFTTLKGRSGNIGYLSITPDGSITYTDVSDIESPVQLAN